MKTYYLKNLEEKNIENLTKRAFEIWDKIEIVKPIFQKIREKWDDAIKFFTEKFDWIKLDNFEVSEEKILNSEKEISQDLKNAINLAYSNIFKFHKNQENSEKEIETTIWVKCFRENRAIEKVGLYIPWWTAALFSTVLMLAIPAQIAKCDEVVLLTPPNKKWEIAPEILFTAKKCWVKKILKIGWAQAIWAISIWTKTIWKVDKIFWPWNSFVTAWKMLAQMAEWVAIDMPAGPSEVLVIWDKNSNAKFIASDLLSQCEHWEDSQSVLILIWDENLEKIKTEIKIQIEQISRKNIAQKSLKNSFILVVKTENEAFNFSNKYAPEHLILHLKNPRKYISKIKNAGSVFLWEFTPESAWDYASWTNHTLPTSGFAKSYSWVSLESFQKKITFQEISKEWIKNIWKYVEIMAEAEGLDAHKNAITVRLKSLEK